MDPESGRSLKRGKTMNNTLEEFKDKLFDTINEEMKPLNKNKSFNKPDEIEIDKLLEDICQYNKSINKNHDIESSIEDFFVNKLESKNNMEEEKKEVPDKIKNLKIKQDSSNGLKTKYQEKNNKAKSNGFKYINECFIVLKIEDNEETKDKDKIKILLLDGNDECRVELRDYWYYQAVIVGNMIRVIGEFTEENNYYLILDSSKVFNENHAKLLIVEPKILISCTDLTQNYCKVYNLEKYSSTRKSEYSNPAIYGKMIHLIFQKIMGTKSNDQHIFDRLIRQAIDEHCIELYKEIEDNEDVILDKLKTALQNIIEWKKIFDHQNKKHNKFKLKLIQQLAIEQELYSKIYGIKGKIDSVCLFEDHFGNREIYAIELKTGVIHK